MTQRWVFSEELCHLTIFIHVMVIVYGSIFMMLSSWHSHCKNLPGLFREFRAASDLGDQANQLEM